MKRFKQLPELNTQRLHLRASTSDDVNAVYKIFSDPDVTRFWDEPIWTDTSQAIELIESARTGVANNTTFFWCICDPGSGEVIGICALRHYSEKHKSIEIIYALLPSHWGRGMMGELIPELTAFGFNQLDLNRIHGETDPRNVASGKVLLNAGFTQEGLLRENWIYAGSPPSDTAVFGLIRSDWVSSIA
jgi:RimJ/RimL family protein N-acetyltransferase